MEAGEAGHHPVAAGSTEPGTPGSGDADVGSAESSESSTGSGESAGSTGAAGEKATGGEEHAEGLPSRLGLEKPLALTAMLVISLLLAVGVWWRPVRPMTGVVALFALAAGVFDVIEISHDVSVDHGGMAVLAGVIAASRLAVIAAVADL